MSDRELIKLFVGGIIAFIGIVTIVSDKISPSYPDDNGKERTFTQGSIWFIGGLIIVLS